MICPNTRELGRGALKPLSSVSLNYFHSTSLAPWYSMTPPASRLKLKTSKIWQQLIFLLFYTPLSTSKEDLFQYSHLLMILQLFYSVSSSSLHFCKSKMSPIHQHPVSRLPFPMKTYCALTLYFYSIKFFLHWNLRYLYPSLRHLKFYLINLYIVFSATWYSSLKEKAHPVKVSLP